MMISIARRILVLTSLVLGSLAIAGDDPIHERQQVMKDVRDAAKPVGAMLRGKADFDAETFMASMAVFEDSAARYGDLFPEGSQSAESEATEAVWDDREGFVAALEKWQAATQAAIAANPQSLDEARPVAGPVFQTCKGCHDTYRLEKD